MTAENVQSLPPEEQTGLTRRRTRGGAFALAFFAAFLCVLLSVVLGMGLAMAVVENSARVVPSYEKVDLTPYLEKEILSEEDYELLYHQTGLTRLGVDALEDRSELLDYQENFFFEGVRAHSMAAVTTPRCVLQTEEGADFYAKLVPLQEGDILVTSTCHTFGWRNGHAAIVVDAESRRVLEATGPGCNSTLGTANWFAHGTNFIVLRLKGASLEERKEIASWAGNNRQRSERRPEDDALQPPCVAGVQALRLRHRFGRRAARHLQRHCAERPFRSRAGVRLRPRRAVVRK